MDDLHGLGLSRAIAERRGMEIVSCRSLTPLTSHSSPVLSFRYLSISFLLNSCFVLIFRVRFCSCRPTPMFGFSYCIFENEHSALATTDPSCSLHFDSSGVGVAILILAEYMNLRVGTPVYIVPLHIAIGASFGPQHAPLPRRSSTSSTALASYSRPFINIDHRLRLYSLKPLPMSVIHVDIHFRNPEDAVVPARTIVEEYSSEASIDQLQEHHDQLNFIRRKPFEKAPDLPLTVPIVPEPVTGEAPAGRSWSKWGAWLAGRDIFAGAGGGPNELDAAHRTAPSPHAAPTTATASTPPPARRSAAAWATSALQALQLHLTPAPSLALTTSSVTNCCKRNCIELTTSRNGTPPAVTDGAATTARQAQQGAGDDGVRVDEDDTVSRWLFSATDTPQVMGQGRLMMRMGEDPESNTEARSDDNQKKTLLAELSGEKERREMLRQTPVAEVYGDGDRDVGGHYTLMELGGGEQGPVFQRLQSDSGEECEGREFCRYRNRNIGTGGAERKSTTDWEAERRVLLIGVGSAEGRGWNDPREDEEPGPEVQENPAKAGGTMYSFVPGQEDILSVSKADGSTEGVTGILRGMLGGPGAEG
ncbi:hypothetical protein BDZ91DRAFT_851323 [Kalaharituber pfeilii]|nr:hypothetical protein BDZ91DRAFT_851323 [Kalaharituber pfeilii]